MNHHFHHELVRTEHPLRVDRAERFAHHRLAAPVADHVEPRVDDCVGDRRTRRRSMLSRFTPTTLVVSPCR